MKNGPPKIDLMLRLFVLSFTNFICQWCNLNI
jgi:hypothetical protein